MEQTSFAGQKPLFEVTRFTAVATWAYEGSSTCSICRSELVDRCIECQNKKKATTITADDVVAAQTACPTVLGICGHRFHKHCLDNWLKSHDTCPLDAKPWVQIN